MTTRDLWYGTSGSRRPKVVFVGEAWGREEETVSQPFVGQSGRELFRMLLESKVWNHNELLIQALATPSFRDWISLRNEWLELNEILLTNVVAERPQENELWHLFHPNLRNQVQEKLRGLKPGDEVKKGILRLRQQLEESSPALVVAVGNYALWATTECCSASNISMGNGVTTSVPGGITSWRGSMLLSTTLTSKPVRVLPLLHPAAILREWPLRSPTVHDLRTRVPLALRGEWTAPARVFLAPPSFDQALSRLSNWLDRAESGDNVRLACDIETSRGCITCVGWADSTQFGMSIPLVRLTVERGFENYWSYEEELILVRLQRKLLLHPRVCVIGQNFIYDMQYFITWFAVRPRLSFDTMLAQHLLFPGTPKGLDYISSLYCAHHRYWKDDGKEWNLKGSLEQLLVYNCEDLVRTFEAAEVLESQLKSNDLWTQWQEQLELNELALDMMERSIAIDTSHRANLAMELAMTATEYEEWFEKVLPDSHVKLAVQLKSKKVKAWYRSSIQQRMFFSHLGLRLPKNRKTGNESFGKEALTELTIKHPEYTRLFTALKEYRSVGVFHNTFIKAPLERNSRMKCSFNTGGTETFRWSSSENAFGRGTNLQNIPMGSEE